MYCRKCGYQLVGLSENRCPECGRVFDPGDGRTFLQRPKAWHARRRRRWVIGILLCLLLLPGLGLGFLYVQWRIEQWAVTRITHLGGTVAVNRTGSPRLQRALGSRLDFLLDRVGSVRLRGPAVTNTDMRYVGRLKQATILDLENAAVTDVGLLALRGLGELQRLDLTGTGITDSGLPAVGCFARLQRLYLGRTPVSDAGLAHLASLSNLQILDLHQTAISGAGLHCLANMPGLWSLYLAQTQITDSGLASLRVCGRLGLLDLRTPGITGTGLKHLSGLPLRLLYLSAGCLAKAEATSLQGLPALEEVILDNWTAGTQAPGLTEPVSGVNMMIFGPGLRRGQGDAEAERVTGQGSALWLRTNGRPRAGPQLAKAFAALLPPSTMPAGSQPSASPESGETIQPWVVVPHVSGVPGSGLR